MDFFSGIEELRAGLAKREVTAPELADLSLRRIAALDDRVHAFLRVSANRDHRVANMDNSAAVTAAAAKSATAPAAANKPATEAANAPVGARMLDGIPYALKDNMCTQGIETTCGSRILQGYIPPYSATAVERLNAAGAVLMGKLNMDEFAMGSSTENSGFFSTRNPWDLERVPGGSSGGAAAAVAAGMVPFALGSDTGGSIRQPAAFCGVVGLKPSYGLVSRYGLVAFASSLDQIGPLTHSVADAAIVLQAIAGRDRRDSTSADIQPPDYRAALTGDVRGLRIGIASEYFGPSVEAGVRETVTKAIALLEQLGATVSSVSLPATEYALAAYYLIAPAEASSNLARYDGVRYGLRAGAAENLLDMYEKTRSSGFGPEVKRRILIGTYALSAGYYDAYYKRAQQVRTLIRQDFSNAFASVDVIVSPTAPTTAFRLGEKVQDPLTMYLSDICTIPVNMAGLPAISVPCGMIAGLPVGLQLIGRMFDEETLLRVAHAYEQAAGMAPLRPDLVGEVEV